MDSEVKKLLEGYNVIVETRVDWGDMDAFRHVNNIVYFRFFENARVEYGIRIGITDKMETEGIGPILAWTDCKYIKPVAFPDTVYAGVRISSLEGSEMRMEYLLVSAEQKAVAAAGNSLGVYYDYRNLKRVDFPEELIARIEATEGRAVPRQHPK